MTGQRVFTVPPFAHPMPHAPQHGTDDVTRRLCAGVYLEEDFAYDVIGETTSDEFRAVPPSLGFDLEPVIRHAFRARNLLLRRDLWLTGLLLAGFGFLARLSTCAWVLFAYAIRRWRKDRALPVSDRRTGLVVTLLVIASMLFLVELGFALLLMMLADYGSDQSDGSLADFGTEASGDGGLGWMLWLFILSPVLLALATLGVLIHSRVAVFRTLTRTLAPGSGEGPPAPPNERIGRRLAWISGAQRGNITLHSTNPFIGAGRKVTLWSMALLLQGRQLPEVPGNGQPSPEGARRVRRDESFDPRAVSALEIQRLVQQSALRLASEELPVNQRVPGVYTMHRVVADGERYQGDPLIDQYTRAPLLLASPEVLAAIIDHPQGGVRYYQQMLIGVDGRAVTLPDGRPVLPAQPQDITVSGHLHVAVEGDKLYLEFLGTVLPPVRRSFNQVDRLLPGTARMLLNATPEILTDWLGSIRAPIRVVKGLWQMASSRSQTDTAQREMRNFRSYDHGARLSVRERGAEQWPVTFLQDLDAFKYVKILEKTVLETVLDYLDRQGVDTSEYRTQMTYLQNHQTIMNSPNFQGPAAFGTQATAAQL